MRVRSRCSSRRRWRAKKRSREHLALTMATRNLSLSLELTIYYHCLYLMLSALTAHLNSHYVYAPQYKNLIILSSYYLTILLSYYLIILLSNYLIM